MSRHFPTYDECHAAAQAYANEINRAMGLEKCGPISGGFIFFHLPNPDNRYGHELTCEIVAPSRFYCRVERFGCVAWIDTGTLYAAPISAYDGRFDVSEGYEVTAPDEDFLGIVNAFFGSKYELDQFAGR